MKLEGIKANFLGDSITQGCGSSGGDVIYMNVLKKMCGLAEARNYGLGGTRIARQYVPLAGGPDFYDLDFNMRAREMNKDADLVVVFGGTNDFGHGDAALGYMSDRTKDTFYGACHELYSYLLSTYPAARIVVMTPTHRLYEDKPEIPNKTATLKDYVNIIKEVAEYYGIPVLDLYATFGVSPKIPAQKELYMPDGLHPNDAGHQKLAEILAAFLKTI